MEDQLKQSKYQIKLLTDQTKNLQLKLDESKNLLLEKEKQFNLLNHELDKSKKQAESLNQKSNGILMILALLFITIICFFRIR